MTTHVELNDYYFDLNSFLLLQNETWPILTSIDGQQEKAPSCRNQTPPTIIETRKQYSWCL